MTSRRSISAVSVALAALVAVASVAPGRAQQRALPDESLYHLDVAFTDQNNRPFPLTTLRGSPVLISMFYGSCQTMCPILIEDAREVDQALTPAERARLRVVLVTIDGERDTAERLRALAAERNIPLPRWTLLRGSDRDVRELAMVLGVQYRRLSNGNYAHSSILTVLDPEGRVAGQVEGLRQPKGALVDRIRSFVRGAS